MILLGNSVTIATFYLPETEIGAHLWKLKINTLQIYYLTVYFNTEVWCLMHVV